MRHVTNICAAHHAVDAHFVESSDRPWVQKTWLISCLKRNRNFLADWTLCLPATGSQTWNFSSNVRSMIQNDNMLWPVDTSAGFDHFKVMISRVLRDRPNIDDAKKLQSSQKFYVQLAREFKFCRRVYKIRDFWKRKIGWSWAYENLP